MGKIRDIAKEKAVKALDRNDDGKLDRTDAELTARAWEERYPLGVILVAFAAGVVLGAIAF